MDCCLAVNKVYAANHNFSTKDDILQGKLLVCPAGVHLARLQSDAASSAAAVAFLRTACMEDPALQWSTHHFSAFSAGRCGSGDDVSADIGGDDISGASTSGGHVLIPRC